MELVTARTSFTLIKDFLNLDKFKKLYYYEDGKKKGLAVGAYQTQDFQFSKEITENPTENGAILADSMYLKPTRIKAVIIYGDMQGLLESIISDVAGAGQDIYSVLQGDFSAGDLLDRGLSLIDPQASSMLASGKIYNKIISLHQNNLPVELITRDRIYKNFQIVSIGRNVAVDNYGGAIIQVDLQELLTYNTPTTSKVSGFQQLKDFASDAISGITQKFGGII